MERSKISEWERHGDFGVLTVNNPPQNYLEEPEFVCLSDLKKWTEDNSLKGLIIMGKGRHFCAGVNQKNIFDVLEEEEVRKGLRKGKAILQYLDRLPIPTVAAIKGVCLGGGLELALSCHIRVSSEKSLFSFPETGLGVMPGLNGTVMLPRQTTLCEAIDLVLTGKLIHAEEALKLKIVDYVVPAREVFAFSMNLLKRVTGDRSLNVIHSVMKAFHNARRLSADAAAEEETRMAAKLVFERVRQSREQEKQENTDEVEPESN